MYLTKPYLTILHYFREKVVPPTVSLACSSYSGFEVAFHPPTCRLYSVEAVKKVSASASPPPLISIVFVLLQSGLCLLLEPAYTTP